MNANTQLVFWKWVTDYAKRSSLAMRMADWMGRGRGRMRFLDQIHGCQPVRKPDLTRWHDRELAAVWIGHSTVLIRIGGMTVLTDPVFSNRIGIGLGLLTGGPHRLTEPAISIPRLPPLDLILISHAHFDHLDRPSLDKLPKRTPVVTAENTADLIRDLGYRHVTELPWGQSVRLGGLNLTSLEVKHWGARTFYDEHRGYCGYLMQAIRRRIFYAGDTAYSNTFDHLGGVDLAIMGIAAYDPWIAGHATPEQVWEMARQMRATHILPVHHSTFRLSYEPITEPIQRMIQAAGDQSHRVVVTHVGGQWAI